MDSLKETADQGRATTKVRKAELGPVCFQDDVAAVSNKQNRCNKKSSGVGAFLTPKEIAVTPGKKPDDCHEEK